MSKRLKYYIYLRFRTLQQIHCKAVCCKMGRPLLSAQTERIRQTCSKECCSRTPLRLGPTPRQANTRHLLSSSGASPSDVYQSLLAASVLAEAAWRRGGWEVESGPCQESSRVKIVMKRNRPHVTT